MLSLIWLNSFLDYFGHPHKQPPPIVLFHGLTPMLFKHSLKSIACSKYHTIPVMEMVVSPLQTICTQWLVLSQNETHCSAVLPNVIK